VLNFVDIVLYTVKCSNVIRFGTGCRRLGEKPVGRKTFERIIFWATDDWATKACSLHSC